jgi:hypothetical protein
MERHYTMAQRKVFDEKTERKNPARLSSFTAEKLLRGKMCTVT